MTTTTTAGMQNKREERMSDYHRELEELGALPKAEELARLSLLLDQLTDALFKATLRAVNLTAFRLTQNEEGSGVFWGGLSSKKRGPWRPRTASAPWSLPGDAKRPATGLVGRVAGRSGNAQSIRR